jgi:hypothetical protein
MAVHDCPYDIVSQQFTNDRIAYHLQKQDYHIYNIVQVTMPPRLSQHKTPLPKGRWSKLMQGIGP